MRSLCDFRYSAARSNEFLSPTLIFFPLCNATSLVSDEYCHLKIFIHWDITMYYMFNRVLGKQGLYNFTET